MVHSLISAIKFLLSQCAQLRPGELLTYTIASISSVSQVTGTGEATKGVGTDSISVTVMSTSGTLINICNQISTESMCPN